MTFCGVLRLVRSPAHYKELSQLGRKPTIEMAFRGYSATSQGIGPSSIKRAMLVSNHRLQGPRLSSSIPDHRNAAAGSARGSRLAS
jgi:hypothetical protein